MITTTSTSDSSTDVGVLDEVDAGRRRAELDATCRADAHTRVRATPDCRGMSLIEHLQIGRQDVPSADEADPDPAADILSGRHDRTYHQNRPLQSSGREPSISAQWFDTGIYRRIGWAEG